MCRCLNCWWPLEIRNKWKMGGKWGQIKDVERGKWVVSLARHYTKIYTTLLVILGIVIFSIYSIHNKLWMWPGFFFPRMGEKKVQTYWWRLAPPLLVAFTCKCQVQLYRIIITRIFFWPLLYSQGRTENSYSHGGSLVVTQISQLNLAGALK